MRNILAVLFFFIISFSLFAQDTIKIGYFGQAKFGDNIDRIKEIESKNKIIVEKPEIIIFEQNTDELKSQNVYSFKKNKLISGLINIINDQANLINYVDEYYSFNEKLKSMYGEPSQELSELDGLPILNDKEKLINEILEGNIELVTVWIKEDHTIVHFLSNNIYLEDIDEVVRKSIAESKLKHCILGEVDSTDEDDEIEESEESNNIAEVVSEEEKEEFGEADSEDDDSEDIVPDEVDLDSEE